MFNDLTDVGLALSFRYRVGFKFALFDSAGMQIEHLKAMNHLRVFIVLVAICSFGFSALADDVCPADGEWKPGYEYLYPSFCRPRDQRPAQDLQTFDLGKYRLRGLPPPPTADNNHSLVQDTKYLGALTGAMLGLMQTLPPEVAGWTETNESFFAVWEKNVHSLPHMDKDSWLWNYVAHPIAGASYYRVCRDKGYKFGQCYLYSFLVSALLWEYGFEAAVERPSTQDLIITPTAGAILGEIMTVLAKEIRAHDGRVLGSKALGTTLLGMLNPMGTMINGLRAVVDPAGERLNAETFFRYGISNPYRYGQLPTQIPTDPRQTTSRIEFGVRIKLKPGWEQKFLRSF